MKTTREYFNSYADRWDEVNGYDESPEEFRRLVALAGAGRGRRIVDLGCGTGVFTPFLMEAVGGTGTIYAVDIAEKMLARLKSRYDFKNVIPIAAPASDLGSVGGGDAIICFSSFPHFDDKAAVIREVARILRSGGRFLIAHFSTREEINEFHSRQDYPVCNHFLPDLGEMKTLLEGRGLSIIHYRNKDGRYELLSSKKE
ncbi:MAG: methyltransferase domain-containing protein [Candidatus Krumholzibacteria bacterium]|nr:methyltransferase domain-containing protein [Candidatus Krumholzibacteria bacterium]